MENRRKEIPTSRARAILLFCAVLQSTVLFAQAAGSPAGPPPSTGGFFPLSEVKAGMKATAWTVFKGTTPEPMDVEILGVLHNGRGPGHDMILAQLHGVKPEFTGVVAGMSGSPVYIGDKLVGSLSYRIGQFSKEPIAGITPIDQLLEVKDQAKAAADQVSAAPAPAPGIGDPAPGMEFQAMETPLVMSGLTPGAVRLWQKQMAGTGLDMVAAGGSAGNSARQSHEAGSARVLPGSAVSMQLLRGDVEIAATCTVTWVDAKHLLACGHPVLQSGPVSLPMTTAEVVATLASPLNAFKIINTGEPIGAFTQDRDSAIYGELGAQPKMIPLHIAVHGAGAERKLNVDVPDLPSLTPQAVLVALFDALDSTNQSTLEMSYHLKGQVEIEGYPPVAIDLWASGGEQSEAPMMAALQTGERFNRLYSSTSRQGAIRSIDLDVEAIPHRVSIELASARLVSGNIVHPGDTVSVEATLRPWRQPPQNVRIPVTIPARTQAGTLRVLVSDAATLDRTLNQPRPIPRTPDMNAVLAEARGLHPANRVYVSLLLPDSQAVVQGQTLTSLPVSVTNALEPMRAAQDAALNGESAVLTGQATVDGPVNGFQVLTLRIEPGGGVN